MSEAVIPILNDQNERVGRAFVSVVDTARSLPSLIPPARMSKGVLKLPECLKDAGKLNVRLEYIPRGA